jgi:hypothetical protein
MDVQVAVLCDAATDSGGKLNILGAFDTIQASALPVVHPQCAIALRATFDNTEEGRHNLRLNFVDEDGRSIMPDLPLIPTEIIIPEDSHFVTCNFIVTIQQLKFDAPGFYSVEISLDEELHTSIPLLVKTPPPQV